ncbi:PQQ-binding-like beta-propeller repeat protein [Dehalobacter sp. DCM]|uniref:outer membrane protein assembly factor BamB family protein n=1 Tax=Dehalobacter sp. DCM TaxID=2907827 RepID=UPI0030815D84|nr:PQQ-binding-like beta-propeller repeat protein [Dehalobacter sp. DCM]
MFPIKKAKSTLIISLITALVLAVSGCSQSGAASGSAQTSLKPQLELVSEIAMGDVAEDKIPDVTAASWTFAVQPNSPIVSPDGKNVLVVGEDKMTFNDTTTGKELWSKATYGGIASYLVDNNRIYMAEKYASKKEKEHGYIICLDSGTGNELWKYDVQSDLGPLVAANMPAGTAPSTSCSIKLVLDEGNIYATGGTSWKIKEDNNKAEVLLCINENGKQVWKKEFSGLPGLISMSSLRFIDGKLVMGNYSYGDSISGPACVSAFDTKTGELAWKYEIPNDPELASSGATNVAVEVVGDKVVAVAHFGKAVVLDANGKKINEFIAYKPEQNQNYTLYTSVYASGLAAGKDEIIICPGSTTVKGASDVKVDVQHSDSNSVMVYSLNGELKWKFRLGGQVSASLVKDKYLLLSTLHNANTLDYSYCGVYVFDLTQKTDDTNMDTSDQNVLDKYVGFYKTDGAVLYNCLSASDDGKVICATTYPTRAGAAKTGKNSLYILKIN